MTAVMSPGVEDQAEGLCRKQGYLAANAGKVPVTLTTVSAPRGLSYSGTKAAETKGYQR